MQNAIDMSGVKNKIMADCSRSVGQLLGVMVVLHFVMSLDITTLSTGLQRCLMLTKPTVRNRELGSPKRNEDTCLPLHLRMVAPPIFPSWPNPSKYRVTSCVFSAWADILLKSGHGHQ